MELVNMSFFRFLESSILSGAHLVLWYFVLCLCRGLLTMYKRKLTLTFSAKISTKEKGGSKAYNFDEK